VATAPAISLVRVTIKAPTRWIDVALPGDVPGLLARNHRAKLVLPGTSGLATRFVPSGLLAGLGDDQGALVYDGEDPQRVQLRRWYDDDELRRRGTFGTPMGEGSTSVDPGPVHVEQDPGYQLVEEVGLFGRRRRPVTERWPEPPSGNDTLQPGVEVAGRHIPSVDEILGR
jgi:hypothetical protein